MKLVTRSTCIAVYELLIQLPPELVEVVDGEAFFRSCKIA
jgi:hypothetical protein